MTQTEIHKQSTMKSFEKGKGKGHLDKDFLEELKHKIWSTKGTRFRAGRRLKTISKYSNFCISFLSAYLIIFGLLSVYNLYNPFINPNLIAFSITGLSILLLVFTLLENSENYKVYAKSFHDCALDLSELYNELQNFKTYNKDVSDQNKMEFAEKIQKEYQSILRRYENHHPIDNKMFRVAHSDYYDVKQLEKIITPIKYFCLTRFLYLLIMFLPIMILFKVFLS